VKPAVYPAAIGCGCLLGAGIPIAHAAEWSVSPVFTLTGDYDSNRRIRLAAVGSESGSITADFLFQRATESSSFSLEPRYTWRRFSDATLGDGDDRSVTAALESHWERAKLNLSAQLWDQSTLLSEPLETGLIQANSHRLLEQVTGGWTWSQTERTDLVAQFLYSDVSYHGRFSAQLAGYRYPSGSIGERFKFSERGSVTASVFGSSLRSEGSPGASRETGLQVQTTYSFTQRVDVDASLGASSRTLAGVSSHGTDAAFSLTRHFELGNAALQYSRALVPYGTGFLVQRQQYTLTGLRQLTPYLNLSLSLLRVQNSVSATLPGVDRRSYVSAVLGLDWHPAEDWIVGTQMSALRTRALENDRATVHEWHSAVTVTWTPPKRARSR